MRTVSKYITNLESDGVGGWCWHINRQWYPPLIQCCTEPALSPRHVRLMSRNLETGGWQGWKQCGVAPKCDTAAEMAIWLTGKYKCPVEVG